MFVKNETQLLLSEQQIPEFQCHGTQRAKTMYADRRQSLKKISPYLI